MGILLVNIHNCIRCNKEVRARQHGIQCDTCHLWQHRTCGTGITLEQYRQAVRGDMQLQWRCIPCVDASGIQANDDYANITMGLATPVAESTRLSLPGIFHGNMQSFEQDVQMYEATSSDDSSDDPSAVSSDDSSSSDDDSSDDSSAVSSDDDSSDSDDDSSDDSSAISSDDDDASGSSDDDSSDDDSSDDGVGSHASLMRSINPDRVSFQQPEPMEESSIVEEERLEVSVHHEGVRTYQIVPTSSQSQKDKLIDSDGYTYNVKSKRGQTTYWQCTVCNKHTNCKASVTERDGTYKEGLHQHVHLGKPGTTTVHNVRAMVKRKAVDDHFKSATAIAEEVLHAELNEGNQGQHSHPLRIWHRLQIDSARK